MMLSSASGSWFFHASHADTGAVARMQLMVFWLGGGSNPWVVHMPTTNGQVVVSESQAFKSRISSLPNVKKFLHPGSQRKPPLDAKQIEEARKVFKIQ